MNIRLYRQIILLFVFASLLSITAFAQGKDEAEAKASLELKLSAITPALCIGLPLKLQLEVTNISQKDVLLNTASVWSQFSYEYNAADGGGRGGGAGISSGASGEKFVLSPGMSYQSTYEFSLASEFFQEAGNYTIKTNLDSVFSNEVKFELYDCGKPQEVKEQK
jgi:hypothetical protein